MIEKVDVRLKLENVDILLTSNPSLLHHSLFHFYLICLKENIPVKTGKAGCYIWQCVNRKKNKQTLLYAAVVRNSFTLIMGMDVWSYWAFIDFIKLFCFPGWNDCTACITLKSNKWVQKFWIHLGGFSHPNRVKIKHTGYTYCTPPTDILFTRHFWHKLLA